jgi:hypothetical protein
VSRTYLQVAWIGSNVRRWVSGLIDVTVCAFVLVDFAVLPRKSWVACTGVVLEGIVAVRAVAARVRRAVVVIEA